MQQYKPEKFESKWQKTWQDKAVFSVDALDKTKDKYYCLVMFPYPSSELHVGHARNYVIGDVVARYKTMRGFYVLSPIGWDAFGLPAENQAIKHKIHPKEWTLNNIKRITAQLKSWGIGYDWDREVTSCKPDYYKWTQWIFLKLHQKGLAYKKMASVNYCPSCKTVLANEQVIDGDCERCDSEVEDREMEQWFFNITGYADRLLGDLEELTEWPDRVKTMQKNWIGKSYGVEIYFPIIGEDRKLSCFTTRVDTIFGASYVVLAPEHQFIQDWIDKGRLGKDIVDFVFRIRKTVRKSKDVGNMEKEGIFTGKYALNPMTGEKIPVFCANYVLMDYGSGAVMAVPAHDGRDFEFAKKYNLPIRLVIDNPKEPIEIEKMAAAYEDEGILVNSGDFCGLSSEQAKTKIAEYMERNNIGKRQVQYKLRDWLISRQRYWGAPIPIIYCQKCGTVEVPESDLPVLLPDNVEFKPTGESPLKLCPEFVNTVCPKCGGEAKREVDTMDTFVDSSWYFLRYLTPDDDKKAFDTGLVNRWLPVDQYIGGIEHATMHLIYARFINKVLYDLGLLNFKEPFKRLFTQGMIVKDGAKMSKSKGNVVAPDRLIEKYGVDTMRLYILFIGPPEKDAEWSDRGVEGAYRFLNRFWRLSCSVDGYCPGTIDKSREKNLTRTLNLTIKKITEDMEGGFKFNTAISFIMELLNTIQSDIADTCISKDLLDEIIKKLIVLISPFAPHIADELYLRMGQKTPILSAQSWPGYSEESLIQDEIELPVQINGRLKSKVKVFSGADEQTIKNIVLSNSDVIDKLKGSAVKKIIVVQNRIINIVV
ncbi:MAG: leucine--tRNA ligase [Candidatus Omnitrophica bacterium]|nr:leucine--tRNA ligase [Candidatus Omnitrophota bacterium]